MRTPRDEIESWATAMNDAAWNGFEVSVVGRMLEADERIQSVDFRPIVTSNRTITRDDMRAAAEGYRPIGASDQRFDEQFTPEAIIAEAEAKAAHAARRVYTSGPAEIIGTEY